MANDSTVQSTRVYDLCVRLSEIVEADPPGEGAGMDEDARRSFGELLLMGAMQLFMDWNGMHVANAYGDVSEHILQERKTEFVLNNDVLADTLELALKAGIGVYQAEPGASPGLAIDALAGFCEAALDLSSSVTHPENAFRPHYGKQLPFRWIRPKVIQRIEALQTTPQALQALHYHRVFVRMAIQAMTLRSHLAFIVAAGDPEKKPPQPESGNAARLRRYRDRRRRRVAAVVPIDLYEDDLELLERFGYLVDKETDNPSLLSAAVETFLLHGFLTHQEREVVDKPPRPWADRIKKQRRRIKTLTERTPSPEANTEANNE